MGAPEAMHHFHVGDRVRVKHANASGNPRTPAYVRGKRGIVTALHGSIDNPLDHRGVYPPLSCCSRFARCLAARAKTRSRWTCTRTGWHPPRPHAEAGTRAKCRGLEAQTRWLAQLEGPVTGASGVSFAKRDPARVWHLREVPAGRGLGNPQKGWLAEGLHLANIRAP